MDNTTKYKAIGKLQIDMDPHDIAEQLDVSYSSVVRLKREYKNALIDGTIDSLVDMSGIILDEVGRQLSDDPEALKAIDETSAKVKGLDRLAANLQQTATEINTRARSLIVGVDSANELEVIADILCKLQVAFVNTNSVQVNVQNNNMGAGDKAYGQFLTDAPGE